MVKRFATTRPIGGETITNLNGTVIGVILARLPNFQADMGYQQQWDNLRLLRQHLHPLGYKLAFVPFENILFVLKTDNQYDLLTVTRTHENFTAFYGKDLIPHLQEWDARYNLDIEQIAGKRRCGQMVMIQRISRD